MRHTIFSVIRPASLALVTTLIVSGCGGDVKNTVRGSLGLNKEAPDEFSVITRAPLEMPRNLALPPPVPGMQRPQEKTTLDTAKQAVFGDRPQGNRVASASSAEAAILEKAGAYNVAEDIREIVNQETQVFAERNTPVAQKLLNMSAKKPKAAAMVVDAKAEYERLKTNLETDRSLLEGDTPMINDY
ncbi:MAG: DUF3035 domain-containing protein [Alphaproteobacteria bacterium]